MVLIIENFKDSVRNEMKISVQKTEIVKLKADWYDVISTNTSTYHKQMYKQIHYINARRGVIVVG